MEIKKFKKYMKKTVFMTALLLVVAVFTSCAQQVENMVSGTSSQNGKTVYLIDLSTNSKLDSAVVKNGKFTMTAHAEKDALLGVTVDGSNWFTMFFQDGTPVTIDTDKRTLKGSALNEQLTEYDLQQDSYITEINNLYQELSAMSEAEQEAKMPEYQQKYLAVIEKMKALYRTIFQEHKQSVLPAAFVASALEFFQGDELKEMINPEYPYTQHPFAKKYVEVYRKRTALEDMVGKQFIDLEEPDTNGKMHKLSEYVGQGKWVFVDFWASWCGPCCREIPNVVKNYNKYHSKGFEVVGLSFDEDKNDWLQAINDLQMPWPHLSDLEGWQSVAAKVYGITSIPASLLIDPTGKIVACNLRGDKLGEKLQEIFGE
jgi:peroxiredoxin